MQYCSDVRLFFRSDIFLIICSAEECQYNTVCTERRLDNIRNVFFILLHHQNMTYPDRMYSDAVSGRSLFCLRFPRARPIQMGRGTQYRLYPWNRSKALPDAWSRRRISSSLMPSASSQSTAECLSSTGTIPGLYRARRRIQVPSVQTLWYGM